jgi:hypothetical protein
MYITYTFFKTRFQVRERKKKKHGVRDIHASELVFQRGKEGKASIKCTLGIKGIETAEIEIGVLTYCK